MGLFDDFDMSEEDIKVNNFDIDDGVYHFVVAEAERQDGSAKNPDNTYFVIKLQLENEAGEAAGEKQSWHTLAVDGDTEHRIAKIGWSTLKQMLLNLGLKGSELQDFEGPEIVGKTGTLQLKTAPAKNGKDPYQNIRNVRVDKDEPEAKPAKKAAAKPKPAPGEESDDDDDDNPFGDD